MELRKQASATPPGRRRMDDVILYDISGAKIADIIAMARSDNG